MTEIPYGRLHAIESVLGGRSAVEQAFEQGHVLAGGGLPSASRPRQAPMWTGSAWVADGVPRIVAVPFAHDTPGLASGVELWTPQLGDLLLDLWISVETAWNGTTPFCDVGTFPGGGAGTGWFSDTGSAVDLTQVDGTNSLDASVASQVTMGAGFCSDLSLGFIASMSAAAGGLASRATRTLPAKFVQENPIKIVVSQNGSIGGADAGATQGAATLYLMVATPASA